MDTHSFSIRPILSKTRILFGLLPGLGSIILLRLIIHIYRPDIEDAEHRIKDIPVDELYNCYDFIIIGGGSAGSVVANRLTENPEWNVLLLEAGKDENVLSEVPVLFPALQTSAIDWQFVTESSDNYCLSMVGKRCKWPRGKVLGGSSTINAMLYIRGNKKDYDGWYNQGNEGWAYYNILKYFLKAEDMRIPEYQNDPYHSVGGPISIENFRYEQPITKHILEAGKQLGYKIRDVNGEFQSGFTRSHGTLRNGLRCSTAKGYLRPAAKRANLHISVQSFVEKVLIDENKVAYGVKFSKHGKSHIMRARKEVILSAGAIQSPQLLMLSGIGDSTQLKNFGIYPITHLPGVGRNLQDHVAMGGHSFLFDNPYTNGSDYCFNLNTVSSIGSLIDFALHKNGPLYSMMEAEAMAFVNTKYQDSAEDYPDIQFFIAPTADNMDGGLFGKRANGLTDETYAELYEDILYDSSFSIVPLLLRPKSRGFIQLRDSNPFTPPLIVPNYYTDPEDMARMIEGARIAQSLIEQPALKKLNARPNPNRNPGCAKHPLMSDDHLKCQARHHSLTIYHPVGTCAMGPASNSDAVVDSRLKVYGVINLRVIDGSIMPTIVSGNTNAPIIMIAEKASDMIKEDWTEIHHEESKCFDSKINQDAVYTKNKLRNAEPVQVKPDIFNEVTSLFPLLFKSMTENYDANLNENQNNANVKLDIKQRLHIVPNSAFQTNTTNSSHNFLASSQEHNTTGVNKFVMNGMNRSKAENNDGKKIQPYPYIKSHKIKYKINSKTMTNKSNNYLLHNSKFSNYNLDTNRIRENINKEKKNSFYINPDFKLTAGKCKIWLYYNGIRYIVQY